jgi:plasmid stabilization system protein ParE
MIRLIVRPAAELDIREAVDWYEEEEPELGVRFLDELQSTLNRLRMMPLQFPSVGRGVLTGSPATLPLCDLFSDAR